MFIGAMIMGPLSAWLLKKFDKLIDGKIPMGFELLINNFSIGIIGSILAVFGCVCVGPAISSLTGVMAGGVNFLVQNNLLPLTAIVIEPAKVLFLNNAIGQGILTPMGTTQMETAGKSVLFMLESNPGPGLGILLAYMIFGKGNTKASAYGASIIHFFGGIHEIYFPFVLMNPILVIPLIISGMVGTFLFTLFGVGLVGVASPGSIISEMIMAAPGDHLKILISIFAAAGVSFAIAIPMVKNFKGDEASLQQAAKQMEQLKGKKSRVSSLFENAAAFDFSTVKVIAYACDAGIGSSAMGASILQKKLAAAGISDVKVSHISIANLPIDCQVVVTQDFLLDRAKEAQPNAYYVGITDFINAPQYDELIAKIKEAKNK